LGQALYGQKFSTRVDWNSVLLIAEKIFGSGTWLESNLPQSLSETRNMVKQLYDDPVTLYGNPAIPWPCVTVILGVLDRDADACVMDDFEEVGKEDDEIPGKY
jgi:hypothetical protein